MLTKVEREQLNISIIITEILGPQQYMCRLKTKSILKQALGEDILDTRINRGEITYIKGFRNRFNFSKAEVP
jgi:hypothetical protein